jgi:hypothetical protein
MGYDTPYLTPSLLRVNQYDRPCAHCGKVLTSGEGTAFLLWDDRKARNTWRAACAHSVGSDDISCMRKIQIGELPPIPVGSVAAKAVAERS